MYARPVSLYASPSNNTANKFVVAVMGMLVAGTGSTYPLHEAELWLKTVGARVSFSLNHESKVYKSEDPLDVRTSVEHIENIRDILNPSMTDLAAVFGVSRQAVYKWISRVSEPEPATRSKVSVLSRVADQLRAANVERPGSLVQMKAFEGLSLMDLVKLGTNSSEHVSALIAEAAKMQRNYSESGLRNSKATLSDSWKSYASIPGSFERV